MQLLTDVFVIENLQVLEEGTKNGVMKVRGVFGRAEEENNNGRIYPNKVLGGQVGTLQDLISERRLCGELDHPQNETVKLSNASHLITKLEMKGNELMGEAEILKTPAGLTAQALINGGVKIGISSRGMGTLSEDYSGKKVVNEDYKLVTFDLVADPSTRGAYPGLSESTQSKFARETQATLTKEGNFVTMLESKLRDAYQPWVEEAMTGKGDTAAERKTDRKRADRDRLKRRAASADDDEYTPSDAAHAKKEEKIIQGLGGAARKILKKESFELVKADGHWHKIAEMIQGSLTEDWGDEDNAWGRSGTATSKDISLERARRKTARAQERVARAQGEAHGEAGRSRGAPGVLKAFRQRAGAAVEAKGERKRTRAAIIDKEKAIATGKGEADREKMNQRRISKDFAARGSQSRKLASAKWVGRGIQAGAKAGAAKLGIGKSEHEKDVSKSNAGQLAHLKRERDKRDERAAEGGENHPRQTSRRRGGGSQSSSWKNPKSADTTEQPSKEQQDKKKREDFLRRTAGTTGGGAEETIRNVQRGMSPDADSTERAKYTQARRKEHEGERGGRAVRGGKRSEAGEPVSDRLAAAGYTRNAEGKLVKLESYRRLGMVLAESMGLIEKKNWIQDAEKSIERRGTEGKCTPITKPGCTGRAKALAKTFKKMAKKR